MSPLRLGSPGIKLSDHSVFRINDCESLIIMLKPQSILKENKANRPLFCLNALNDSTVPTIK